MNDTGVAARAKELGVGSLPAVAIDGRLASCCAGRGPDLARLREAGPAARFRFGPARWPGSERPISGSIGLGFGRLGNTGARGTRE